MKKLVILIIGNVLFSLSYLSVAQSTGHKHHNKKSPIIGKTKASRLLSTGRGVKKSSSEHTDKLRGQFNISNNYIFRGISQTNNYPTAQGGASYTFFKQGPHVGIWGSNVTFVDEFEHTAFIELDPSIGFTKELGKDINYDVSVTYYYYPDVRNSSYPEFNAYFNYSMINTHFAYSNDIYAVGKAGTYYNVGLNYMLPAPYFFNVEDVRLWAAIGYSDLPKNRGLQGYQDYSVTLSKTINHFECALQWTDTNGKSFDKPALVGNLFTFTIGRSF